MSEPTFAVVGHVNRGKSSIVSTLAADETVVVDDTPGTTRVCRRFPARIGDETLYTLIDTPGFERARHVLHWIKSGTDSTQDRRKRVAAFLAEHAGSNEFAQECELLRPILDGAAILYVVDGSVPFRPSVEAETEILQWTGQPRMALINPIGDEDYSHEWRPVLDQYFSLVRVFDAHHADFHARVELLRALRELSDPWRAPIDRAIEIMTRDRAERVRESAGAIADGLCELLSHVEEQRLGPDESADPHTPALEARYYDHLRERELRLRQRLRQIYAHPALEVSQAKLERVETALFDTSTWSRLGLSRPQLVAAGAATGAVVGGTIDAALGGASVLLGATLGTAVGAATTWFGWDRLARVEILGAHLGGKLLRVGPMRHPNFPWVVLDRALIFHHAVSRHAHARREPIDLHDASGIVSELSSDRRKPLQQAFDQLRKRRDASSLSQARTQLVEAVEPLLRERD